ncbi:MAG: patatin-like phospholipase family protein [Beijerinckiaceae bacterium]|nr:patatin-like phospholipase family protein [Beijerinckiaceae bacterium]
MAEQNTTSKPSAAGEEYDRKIALVLQGGGALGSYQAGVFQAMAETGFSPKWVAGISVGAINAAIIAGNAPENRVARLREFWEEVSSPSAYWPVIGGDFWGIANRKAGSLAALIFGQPGFFKPTYLENMMLGMEPTSYYSTGDLKRTLERLVDFDRINSGETRLSVGAVNVRTGNFNFFDSDFIKIRPEHVMASGALPPGFPAVEIDGEYYWDGGLVSNTPLHYVLNATPRFSMLVFQVDLFPAEGHMPHNLDEVSERLKDIQYSSRTRLSTTNFQEMHDIRHKVSKLLKKLPEELRNEPEAIELKNIACQTRFDIVQLIYRPKTAQGSAKDYEFSRMTMLERWAIGQENAALSLEAKPWLAAVPRGVGVRTFDLLRETHDRQEKVAK